MSLAVLSTPAIGAALAGGALIGAAASLLLTLNGRIAGISGIVGGLFSRDAEEVRWRALFVAGLLAGGTFFAIVKPEALLVDPTLVFVMAGAIIVHMGFALRAKRALAPLLAPGFVRPVRDAIDTSLFVGASLFGVGWGLQGYCPGPAIVASASGSSVPIVFLASMIAGMLAPRIPGAIRALGARAAPRHDSPTAA
jgi:uncharacterized membrane protein YedE/YeeE